MLYLRFLFFLVVYGLFFWFAASFLGVTIVGIVQSTCDETTFKAVKDAINWVLRVWVFLFTPVLAFQTARRRATSEANFFGAFSAAILDFRMMFGFSPIIDSASTAPRGEPSAIESEPPQSGDHSDNA
jgi:hypothetical protein